MMEVRHIHFVTWVNFYTTVNRSCDNQKHDLNSCRAGLVWDLSNTICSHLLTMVLCSRILLPWRWRRYVPPKGRLTQDVHSATSQKTTFFIVTAVKASNLTSSICIMNSSTQILQLALQFGSVLCLNMSVIRTHQQDGDSSIHFITSLVVSPRTL
jgi:hypothetical protein